MPNCHKSRVRVRVRSCCQQYNERVDGYFAKILQYLGQSEAREMCDEDARGERLFLREPVAVRLSPKKAPLTDIRLLAPARSEKRGEVMLSASDAENNAFNQAFKALGDTDSIRQLERATAKYQAWPDVHDDRNVIICAGKVHGVTYAELPTYHTPAFISEVRDVHGLQR